ncbi:sulfite exporter TauE/SafE family protein [Paraflavitalea speifideaquila]|uniref:sulfite exporter TauE/SafE family protein n=1 Tax=Paraflavitalea speifideaquila TaxID=3076558 RepID=UPI0028E2583C|nr:sulfite exporter TauE/SafE family protein [Paraflavitalea speifideiaquila]
MAYIGARITLHDDIYKKILGVVLLISVVRFLMPAGKSTGELRPANRTWLFIIGGSIGLLSGMIGIGGGIILSPILLLLRWVTIKQSAALSAIFIFVNSFSGLVSMIQSKTAVFTPSMYAYIGIALIGGLAGAYLGAARFKNSVLKYILAAVLLLAVFKLVFTTA